MTKLNSSFMIGNVEIPHRTVLAPMAGVNNSAFRTIAKEFGAGLVVMEMLSEKGLLYNNEKTLHMLHIDENEHPMSIQLFGGDAEGLKRAADFIQTNTKADIVDINMGCPVNKVVKNEAGAKWLKDPDKIYHIVKEVTSVLDIPLTVKMRTGWSDSDLAVENALAASYTGEYPIITGQDCDIANVKNLIAGKQAMSVFKDTRTLASQVVKMVDAVMQGGEAEVNDTKSYDNGTGVIPTYLCEPVVVTIDNYKEMLIDSGYYTEDQLK